MNPPTSTTQVPRRVALVDDHEIVAVALASAVGQLPGLEFVGFAATVPDLVAKFDNIDLVVLDLRLTDGSSPANNVDQLVLAGANVLAFTSGEDPYLVRLVAKTPVLGVVRKSEPVAVLLLALTRAAAGEAVVSTEWASALASDPDLRGAGLSPQEEKVLSLFASGSKAQMVASETGIAASTVDDYIRRIRVKYALNGRAAHTKVDLYKRALEDGFLPVPGSGR